jgi:aryl-alcohol dehydrogenase-like predicted oxidoreductase
MRDVIAQGGRSMLKRSIHKTGEQIPAIGLGSWQTMDIPRNSIEFETLAHVWREFFGHGGTLVDTSPMYGKSEASIGFLSKENPMPNVFYATKVWTRGESSGKIQIQKSFDLMKTEVIDLFQIHNLLDALTHLKFLRALREKGKVRYIGLTHYVPSAFLEMEKIARSEQIDFIQIPYSITSREAEERILPFAYDNKISVLVNRPFEEGTLFRSVKGKVIPDYFKEWQCTTFSQCFLKYILSHPAITCVIPATNKVSHLLDNMQAGFGILPDDKERVEFRKQLLEILDE